MGRYMSYWGLAGAHFDNHISLERMGGRAIQKSARRQFLCQGQHHITVGAAELGHHVFEL